MIRTREWFAEPPKVVAIMLAAAAALALVMALISAYNVHAEQWFGHPDEYLHRSAARYYIDHWLPPRVGDTATLDSYSRDYGNSYLNELEVVYPLAGKFSNLVAPLVANRDLGFRLFNVTLLGVLALLCFLRPAAYLAFVPLLLTPQVWYIFGYFNGDAFPLFLSILIAYQVAAPESSFNRYLDSPGITQYISGALLLALLVGLLWLSKRNYYAFLALAPAVVVLTRFGLWAAIIATAGIIVAACVRLDWVHFTISELAAIGFCGGVMLLSTAFFRRETRRERGLVLLKLVSIGALAIGLITPRYLADIATYGSLQKKDLAMGAIAEQLAKPEYKPSKIYAGDPQSFRGTTLRTRGVKFTEIFAPPWNWHIGTMLSATGHYGWLQYRSPTLYYVLLGATYVSFLLYWAWAAARSHDPDLRSKLLLMLLFAALMIGVSASYSWTSDFQSQGRYLFPILPMVAVGLESSRKYLKSRIILALVAVCFTLSAYSFIFTALWEIPKGS
jgi:hypothetical protein